MSCAASQRNPTIDTLPLSVRLPVGFSLRLEEAFDRLKHLPHCLWLDSSAGGPRNEVMPSLDENDQPLPSDLGRYSFLTADPVDTLVAQLGEVDPWPRLRQWCLDLPTEFHPDLPPFQGGIAGLIGYEAATWLESVGTAEMDDLPTSAISLGLYDWTIAVDHQQESAWIISQGLGGRDPDERRRLAQSRLEQVQRWLSCEPESDASTWKEHAATVLNQHATAIDGVTSNLSSREYRARVQEIVRRICDGDSFQVNLAQRLLCRATDTAPDLYVRLREHNPAPFSAFYAGEDFHVLSSSPEGFLKVRDRQVETRPIKGTVARTGDIEEDRRLTHQLLASDKDLAENVMIVDLMRNDLSRVCDAESVQVRKLCGIERYEYVQHLVSVVEGRLAEDQTIADLLQATFPGGSITGAPKIEAMKTIAQLEPHRRGPYCGSIGYISCGGNADFNILIRTITAAHGFWQIPVGGGITARSEPASEEAETWDKAKGMLAAIQSKND
ncbi:MAG: anthranilate synthase component I family protein [Planctomycetota bacterium]